MAATNGDGKGAVIVEERWRKAVYQNKVAKRRGGLFTVILALPA